MKKKIGTVVSETLYYDVKVLATRERRLISEIVGLALDDYVQRVIVMCAITVFKGDQFGGKHCSYLVSAVSVQLQS